jgi:DHA1 family tetracycline resistance protein-like MFS transporter
MADTPSTLPTDTDAAAEPISPPSLTNRSALLIVFLVVFIDLLGFGIVLPLLPRYARDFLPPDTPKFLGGLTIGLLYSSFSAMQFLFAPLWGRVSDRVGRRPILLLGLLGSVVFYGLFAYASMLESPETRTLGLILLFVSRIGAGIAGATIATAAAVIADSTTPEGRSRGMALIGVAFGIGFTVGPLLAFGAVFTQHEARWAPGVLASSLSFLALVLGLVLLPETRQPGRRVPHRGWLDWHSLLATLRTPTVGLLVITFFLATFGFANFEATLSLLTKEAFDYGEADNFLVFAFVGATLMVAQGLLYRRLANRVSELTFIRIGVLLMLLGLANLGGVAALSTNPELLPRSVAFYWFLAALAVAVTGFAFLNPSVQSLISRRSDPAKQGEALGVNQSASALARILGPAIGLSLFTLTATHVLPYLVASGLLAVVLALTPRLRSG